MIPPFRDDGYLPEGLHEASEAEALFRFGSSNRRRRTLALRLKRWIELSRNAGVLRFLLDGSFITSKPEPKDVDIVVLLSNDFSRFVSDEVEAAVALQSDVLSGSPAQIFAAEDVEDWGRWIEFFSRTREADGRRKRLVEVLL